MLVWFANPRSATALIQMCNADRNALDLRGSTLLVSPTAPCSPAATPSNKAFYHVPASQTHRPLRSNPRSASRTPAVPSSRFLPLEDFVRRPHRAPNRTQRPASEILHNKETLGSSGHSRNPDESDKVTSSGFASILDRYPMPAFAKPSRLY
jgi:hypothetical protein